MAVSNTAVKALYQGNGSNVTFAIPFAFIALDSANEIDVYNVDTSGNLTLQTRGVNYDFDVVDPALADPVNIVYKVAYTPSALTKVLIIRDVSLQQIASYTESGPFPAKTHEKALDRIVLMVQQLSEKVARTLGFNILDDGNVNMAVPKVQPSTLIGFNAAGDAVQLYSPSDIVDAAVGGGALPGGGAADAVLVKQTATDGDAVWNDVVFSGISRFGAWSSAGLMDTLTKILNITYTPPTISLTGSGSGTIREKGTVVASTLLSATVTKQSDPIAGVRFYQGATLINTVASPNPAGGVETYTYATPFSDTISFSSKVDDNGATGGPTTVTSNTVTFTFVYPYYSDAGAAGKTPAQVGALTKTNIVSTVSVTKTMTATAGQVFYFAYPAAYGVLTSILDVNGFETIADWTLTVANITGLDATAQSYNIYEFNNPVTAGSYQYTFKR